MMYIIRHVTKKLFSPKYLLVTNTITSGGLMALGDAIQQERERRAAVLKAASTLHGNVVTYQNGMAQVAVKEWDWRRTGRMLTIGLLLGPLNHYWYHLLDKFLVGASGRMVAKKVLLDELIASPIFTTCFFVGVGLLEGKGLEESVAILRKKFLTVYMMDLMVWPPVQAVNFLFVPPHLRVIYVNFFILIWDVFLSFMVNKH